MREDKEVQLDPALQADMDEFLDECFNEGTLVSILTFIKKSSLGAVAHIRVIVNAARMNYLIF